MQLPPFISRAVAAFSLVEVTAALGIASFGLVTMIALLPQGLRMVSEASDSTVKAEIVRTLSSELYATAWNAFPNPGYGPKRYYDIEGTEVGRSDPLVAYIAAVHIPSPAQDAALPQRGGTALNGRANLRKASICIVRTNNVAFDFDAPSQALGADRFPLLFANMNP